MPIELANDEKNTPRLNSITPITITHLRLKMSLEAGKDAAQIIAFLHYPPVFGNTDAAELTGLLRAYGVRRCYYGHLHGKAIRYAVQGERGGVQYKLISADGLAFCPYKLEM